MMVINELPGELLLYIHSILPLGDLKNAVLVDKWWNKVGEDPILWRGCVVTFGKRADIIKFSSRRSHRIQNIYIKPGNDGKKYKEMMKDEWELLFQTIEKLPEVKNIDGLQHQNLMAVNPNLLARALTVRENVDLKDAILSTAQISSILQHILQHTTKVKKLCVNQVDLSTVKTEILAEAVNKLEGATLEYTKLSTSQITSILLHVMEDNSKLKMLELSGNELTTVKKEVIDGAVNKLEKVDLTKTKLSSPQITSILTNIMEKKSKLKKLNLGNCDLSSVEEELLATAVSKLEEVQLYYSSLWKEVHYTKLSTSQITRILEHIVQKDSKIKKINLRGNNLLAVEKEVPARAVQTLEDVSFVETDISAQQIAGIFTHIAEDNTKVKKYLNVFYDLSAVEEEVLAEAVNRLEEVNLERHRLNNSQITRILTHIKERHSKLKKLILRDTDLSMVENEVLGFAVNKLEVVDLGRTGLRSPQTVSILTNIMEQDSKLKILNLWSSDLSPVEEKLLARAVNRLEEVGLCSTNLRTEQINSILIKVANQDSKLKKLGLGGNDLSFVEQKLLASAVNKLEEVALSSTNLRTNQINCIFIKTVNQDSKLNKLDLRGCDLSVMEEKFLARATNLSVTEEKVRVRAVNILGWSRMDIACMVSRVSR